ncbi:MAG: arginase family protein [Trueperaceae bacterium]
MDTLQLLFPQWQGSGHARAKELRNGALSLRDVLAMNSKEVDIEDVDTETSQNILRYADIVLNLEEALNIIQAAKPKRILTIGGDCGVDAAPVRYLNHYYKDLAVLWIDAHADLNTPESSPSKSFHGMILRTLLGEGDATILDKLSSPLSADQVFLAGVREFDPPELAYSQEQRLKLFGIKDLESNQDALVEVMQTRGFKNLHIHLDLDVLDPSTFASTCYPTPNGLSVDGLLQLLAMLCKNLNVVGFTLTEFTGTRESDKDVVKRILEKISL